MKQIRMVSLLLGTLLFMVISLVPAWAATSSETTATAATTAKSATASDTADAAAAQTETTPQKKSLGKQILILLAFAAGVGILAALYGIISMKYNADKISEMKEESQKIIQNMNQKE